MTGAAFKWAPIEDLPLGWEDLSCPEVASLESIWRETRGELDQSALDEFNVRLAREWAIETGLIEGLYVLDRGMTNTLIEVGFDASSLPHSEGAPDARTFSLLQDQVGALDLVFDVISEKRALSTSFVKELHALLTRHQVTTTAMDHLGRLVDVPLRRGDWKTQPNNPKRPDGRVHEYCPPEQTAAEMDRLVGLHIEHISMGVPPEIEAAWLHHRFAQIHPFQDGNGRVARCLASFVLIKAGLFPLVVDRNNRDRYISRLEQADAGDLVGLVDLIAEVERRRLRQAIGIADAIGREAALTDQVIGSFGDLAHQDLDRVAAVFELADQIHASVDQSLGHFEKRLQAAAAGAFRIRTDSSRREPSRAKYNRYQKIQIARAHEHFAALDAYDQWSSLRVERAERQLELIVTIHGIGPVFRGLCAVSIAVYERTQDEDGHRMVVDLDVTVAEPFVMNHHDGAEDTTRRFEAWFEREVTIALAALRRRLG